MSREKKRLSVLLACFLLIAIVVAIVSSSARNPFRGDDAEYYRSLLDAGFPASYAKPLTELHREHPAWVFLPLLITEQNPDLTWSHVLEKETASAGINVVSGSDQYTAYRHRSNEQTEPGFFRASTAAVAYFLDPRNFLNETDVFQFLDLSGGGQSNPDGLAHVLKGTFLEHLRLENGLLCSDYLTEVGAEIGIDPVYVAVRIRQEMGVDGTSPVISGACGSLLLRYYTSQDQRTADGTAISPPGSGSRREADLLAYDGLYNFFNFGATGKGLFDVYEGAMKRAQSGTAAMNDAWGGSPAWNTRWKAIWGGAYSLCRNYIGVGQYTLYLQKFDVNRPSGERAFTHQYMANVMAARTEGRSLYRSYAASDALDSACVFRIPVYDGMPRSAVADPAGTSLLSAAFPYRTDDKPHILPVPDDERRSLSYRLRNTDFSRKEPI